MNDVVLIDDDVYQRYEDLLIRKDVLKKEAVQYEINYIREFGELIAKSFEAKIACIEKKKIIAYCQSIINKGGTIDASQMEDYISVIMKDYYLQLQQMLDDNYNASSGSSVSEYEFRKIKKIYYAIAKLIHPDMNPSLKGDETIADLWNKTVIAYDCNQLKELEELQVLVNRYLASIDYKHGDIQIDNIEEKIFELNEEIDRIINTDPYTYKYLLADEEAINDKKNDLKNEIEDYKKYAAQLDEVIASFNLERKYS
nr:hypothetical protein [Clostridia bacterium]